MIRIALAVTGTRPEQDSGTKARENEQLLHGNWFLRIKLICDLTGCRYIFRKRDTFHGACTN